MAKEHLKASDVWKNTQPVFGSKVCFDEAFPQIDDVRVEVEEHGAGAYGESRRQTLTKDHIGEFVDCSNPICYRGGFRLGRILREMVDAKQTELATSTLCQGSEGSPKGRRIYQRCTNHFKINLTIKYKPTPGSAT